MHCLVRHPATPPGAIHSVEASLERTSDGAIACFVAVGDTEKLVVPKPADPVRTNDLWRTTCFELFVGAAGERYGEFNLSPSGAWAAYRFDDYRHGMADAPADVAIKIELEAGRLILVADIRAAFAANAPIGMTAVIAETDGHIRYWASSFAPGKPDFHAPAVRSLILNEVDAE
jgi:hypothetical protein